MTTVVKVTGTTTESARKCLAAALEYMNNIPDAKDFSLIVSPFSTNSINEDGVSVNNIGHTYIFNKSEKEW